MEKEMENKIEEAIAEIFEKGEDPEKKLDEILSRMDEDK